MLLCFGISWPVSIVKTYRTKTVHGTSPLFYAFVLIGYLSGIMYKLFFCCDTVIYFYMFNALMVATQIALFGYYTSRNRSTPSPLATKPIQCGRPTWNASKNLDRAFQRKRTGANITTM